MEANTRCKNIIHRLRSMAWRERPEHVEIAKYRRVKTLFIQVVVSLFAQVIASGLVLAQVLTHGPVVGGVTSSQARVFIRTDQNAKRRTLLWGRSQSRHLPNVGNIPDALGP